MDCIRCKGRVESKFACGRDFCPIYARSEAMFKSVDSIFKDEFQGTSPSVFVGRYGYPKVNVGILAPTSVVSNAEVYDAPSFWAKNDFSIKRVVELRSSLVNSKFPSGVKTPSKNLSLAQEIALSSKPVDVDIKLFDKPAPKISFSGVNLPMGPSALLRNIDIASNPKVSLKVDKAVSDTDLKSADAVKSLYKSGSNENFLSRVLSVGVLGLKNNRKLVPTRWSITAVDDMLGRMLINETRDCAYAEYQMFHGNLYGNYYFIMLFPDAWSYELFEGYLPHTLWNSSEKIEFATDYESNFGRKSYAENTAGGYYAARLAIVEKLKDMKKQASVLVIRVISNEYSCPLGVFVCRESVRKALSSSPIGFSSKGEMTSYVKALIMKMFNYDVQDTFESSILLKNVGVQTRLFSFSPEPDSD